MANVTTLNVRHGHIELRLLGKAKKANKSSVSDFDSLLRLNKYRHNHIKGSSGDPKYLSATALMLYGFWQDADRLLKQRTDRSPISPILLIVDHRFQYVYTLHTI